MQYHMHAPVFMRHTIPWLFSLYTYGNVSYLFIYLQIHTFVKLHIFLNQSLQPWCGGSAGWSIIPYTKGLLVRSPVRAHASVTGSIFGQGKYGRNLINVSLSPCLPILLRSINIIFCEDQNRERNQGLPNSTTSSPLRCGLQNACVMDSQYKKNRLYISPFTIFIGIIYYIIKLFFLVKNIYPTHPIKQLSWVNIFNTVSCVGHLSLIQFSQIYEETYISFKSACVLMVFQLLFMHTSEDKFQLLSRDC